jgi:acetyl-CoA C-acetyltransferase
VHGHQPDVLLATLNARHVRAIDPGQVSQLFLRYAAVSACLLDGMPERHQAQSASKLGAFDWEISPIVVSGRKGDVDVRSDEPPRKADAAKVSSLKPAFRQGGTVTAANSSSIADGAAALMLMRRSTAERHGVVPLATIVGHATNAIEPALFPTAPVGAVRSLLSKTRWSIGDVDAWEFNEAFAVVPMAAMRRLEIDYSRVNIHGGACALGHPIGASGARILVTLLGALRRTGGKRGIASLCIGGGEATAMAIELV